MILRAILVTTAFVLAAPAAHAASAKMVGPDGKEMGTLELSEAGGGVKITGTISGLTPGEHAFHIHETGKCEPPFTSAGGHYNPGGHKHGKVEGGSHAGDMDNLTVGADGTVKIEVTNTKITLKSGEKNTVFDDDGSAFIIHAKADDYKTQPTGDAGGRAACGIIVQ
ncbi:MAG: superoxide dismutase family protein [Hyphomicrobiales bacterium]